MTNLPTKHQNRRNLLLILIPLFLATILTITSCADTNPPTETNSTTPISSTPTTTFQSSLPITDSFTLTPYDEAGLDQERGNLFSDYAFNKYGVYTSQGFFIKEGETVQIVIQSNYPISFEDWSDRNWRYSEDGKPEFQNGLIAYLSRCSVTCENCGWVETVQLERVGQNWQVQALVSPDSSDFYYLLIDNDSGMAASCSYSISLK